MNQNNKKYEMDRFEHFWENRKCLQIYSTIYTVITIIANLALFADILAIGIVSTQNNYPISIAASITISVYNIFVAIFTIKTRE